MTDKLNSYSIPVFVTSLNRMETVLEYVQTILQWLLYVCFLRFVIRNNPLYDHSRLLIPYQNEIQNQTFCVIP